MPARIKQTTATSPCYNCEERSPGCHGVCGLYAQYYALCQVVVANRAAEKKINDEIIQFTQRVFPKQRRQI